MRYLDEYGTLWLDVVEFAYRQGRPKITIWKWVQSGFIVELGYLIKRSRGRGRSGQSIRIGIPRNHHDYAFFSSSLYITDNPAVLSSPHR